MSDGVGRESSERQWIYTRHCIEWDALSVDMFGKSIRILKCATGYEVIVPPACPRL